MGFGKKTAWYLRAHVDFLRRRVAEEGVSDDRLFLCHGGHSRDGEDTFGESLTANGIKLHPHNLRHTFSTEFLTNGGSAADLQRIPGHESPQMSPYDAHVTNTDAVKKQKSNGMVNRQLWWHK